MKGLGKYKLTQLVMETLTEGTLCMTVSNNFLFRMWMFFVTFLSHYSYVRKIWPRPL
jgi:hypothetical protein